MIEVGGGIVGGYRSIIFYHSRYGYVADDPCCAGAGMMLYENIISLHDIIEYCK